MAVIESVIGIDGWVRYEARPRGSPVRVEADGSVVVDRGELVPVAGPMELEELDDGAGAGFVWCEACGWRGPVRACADDRLRLDALRHRC